MCLVAWFCWEPSSGNEEQNFRGRATEKPHPTAMRQRGPVKRAPHLLRPNFPLPVKLPPINASSRIISPSRRLSYHRTLTPARHDGSCPFRYAQSQSSQVSGMSFLSGGLKMLASTSKSIFTSLRAPSPPLRDESTSVRSNSVE